MTRVAILGAGIMGACLALYLARRNIDVTLFDAADAPLSGASRWNEGKIHLGYLYAGDPTLETARRVLPGGLAFADLIKDLIAAKLDHITTSDDLYLVHRDSVVGPENVAAYFDRVSQLVREAPGANRYLADARAAASRQLTRDEIAAIADPSTIVAGFTAPERSLATVPVADQLCAALAAEPRITLRLNTIINAATPVDSHDGPWIVEAERFDWVVNALWHGRIAIDAQAGLAPAPGWSHRYRVSAFVRTGRAIEGPSSVIAVGPFGDVKNYNGRDFYLSWYPAGLMAETETLAPPQAPHLTAEDKRAIASNIAAHLGTVLPWVRDMFSAAEHIAVEGGYVFAQGRGSLADARATLHNRSAFGVRRLGRYISIDTGKYSTAPLMARDLAAEIAGA